MSSRCELDDGIKSIKSAWQREHTARANLEKMLENAEAENAKLRELVIRMRPICIQGTRCTFADKLYISKAMEELGIEVTENE